MACKYAISEDYLQILAGHLEQKTTPESVTNGFWNFLFLFYFTDDHEYAVKPELNLPQTGRPDLLVTRQIIDVVNRTVDWEPWVIVYEGKREGKASMMNVSDW